MKRIFLYSCAFLMFVLATLSIAFLFTFEDTHKSIHLATPTGAAFLSFDHHGIPFITGDNLEAIGFATGYAQAKQRLWAMHFLRLFASGRLSEVKVYGKVVSRHLEKKW